MTPEVIFDGPHLRAELFNGAAEDLFVSFRQRINAPGHFDDAAPVRSFVNHGFAHLHIQSKVNDWYINADTAVLDNVLTPACQRYDKVVSMGFSMGGYGALRFARSLGVQDVLLISPQVSIHPDVVPWDRRYRSSAAGFELGLGDLGQHGKANLRGFILYDPFRPMDHRNAQAIHRIFPKVLPCRLAGGGHPATKAMRASGALGKFQRMLREGTLSRSRVLNLHRSARAGSAYYWGRLSEQAARYNRPALAQTASNCADHLALLSQG